MGAKSTGSHPTTTKADGHLLEYFRQNFGAGGGGTNPPIITGGLTASGGIISDYTDPGPGNIYRAHVFTGSGTFNISALGEFGSTVEYLVVAGGGGGGKTPNGETGGGGGGGGGYQTSTLPISTSPGSYTVTIGAGGVGGGPERTNGGDSVFATITSKGGGAGAIRPPGTTGNPGGSGGGGSEGSPAGAGGFGYNPSTPGPVLSAVPLPSPYPITQGYPGGTGGSSGYSGGGGGGAGGAGSDGGTPGAAPGGNGASSSITGSSVTYAGGGGGALYNGRGGNGGPGGGGGGTGPGGTGTSWNPTTTVNGEPGKGGGGGGSYPGVAGQGGSGVVVVRYQIGSITADAKATGGVVSFYNNKTIHTFTSSGAFATAPNWSAATVDYLVVGGGGAGGSGGTGQYGGGGGGAGAVRIGTTPIGAHPVSTTIQVGAGGAGIKDNRGNNGTSSYFGTPITAPGGGGGGGKDPAEVGGPGGSGGGSKYDGSTNPGGTGTGDDYPGSPPDASPTNGWGNDGGAGSNEGAGGGGGAGSAGSSSPGSPIKTGGPGGTGIQIPSTFFNPANSGVGFPGSSGTGWIAGGGGGSTYGNPNAGGGGGGGAAAGDPALGYAGAGWGERIYPVPGPGGPAQPIDHGNAKANSGSGGGGSNNAKKSFDGGSGIVIIAYPT